VQDLARVVLEHVDLLDAGERLHRQLLERCLQLLVVARARAADLLLLGPRQALAAGAFR
jgi:hypothetical protein